MQLQDTITALSTAPGAGAIAVIRVSGSAAIAIVSGIFKLKNGAALEEQPSHTLHLGDILDGDRIIDESLVSLFRGSKSYTGEPTVEISCHGSPYIQQEIIQLLLRRGCRAAKPGEFTLRAFINGKMDLSQAEAVADLIASDTQAGHQMALQQMRGGFSAEIAQLRQELLDFASLIELELDFAEEDVEFANRDQFQQLITKITRVLKRLIDSFATGNVMKNGIPVAIVGEPNVGKSTLLNALLNEERAIVSDIAGTTRDSIEDEISIDGIGFRFIDTAGIRETEDIIEGLGIKKTFEKIEKAQVILYLINSPLAFGSSPNGRALDELHLEIEKIKNRFPDKPLVLVANKIDHLSETVQHTMYNQLSELISKNSKSTVLLLSARTGTGVDALKEQLLQFVNTGALRNNETLVTNSRHYDALLKALEEIEKVQEGLHMGLSGDLMAIDIREALYHFGEITGQVTNDELLGNIFANFCIGK